jgi:sulfur-carrier protein
MKLQLFLYASLASLLPPGSQGHSAVMELEDGTTVQQLLDRLTIRADMPKIVFLNGLHAKGEEILKEGDRVAVFPPIAGG